MKKFLIVTVVLAAVGFVGFKKLDNSALERSSKQRVEGMLKGLQSGSLADEQDAIGYWRVGFPEATTEAATNAFGRFRSEGGLAEVKSFSVVSTQLVPGTDTVARAVEVTAEINGKTVRLRARHKQPLEWIR